MVDDMTTPDGKTNTMPGEIYTMLSRAKSMEVLKLCAFHANKIKVNESTLHEMERLDECNTGNWVRST
jgi:ABC-type molybdate transport system permease subunit